MMNSKKIYGLLAAWIVCLGWALTACSEQPTHAQEQSDYPAIFPDYVGVTIPCNIAPLNFRLDFPAERCLVRIGERTYSGKQSIRFDEKEWRQLLEANKGKTIEVELYTKQAGVWSRWKNFPIYVSDRAIDSHLVYRLIEPGYEKWHIVGIYQRNLTNFEEAPIIRNDMTGYNCMNCHTFCMGDPGQMLFHMRAANGATYLLQNGKLQKLNTKTNETISNLTYPAWHPSGRYLTTSVNTIRQFFHSVKEKKMEVFDSESDVVVYDIQQQAILSAASIITKEHFETFPAFSPDGKWLYFCSAPAKKMPEEYDQVRYNLCRVAFDAERGAIELPVDTLVRADSMSCTFPRISPDGRFLLYTETAYGQFPIWHSDAEQRMLRLSDRQPIDMRAMNSEDTDSYHSWSSGSDWVVFSSRRDNGLYTLPYLCGIDAEGNPAKPFLLPQADPEKYDYQLYSYNIPELVKGEVTISPYEIQQVALNEQPKQVKFK